MRRAVFVAVTAAALVAVASPALAQAPQPNAVPTRVVGVFNATTGPVIVLEVVGRGLYLPIWVADREAEVAQGYLQGQPPQRPLTHDLLLSVVSALGARLLQVYVADLQAQTFIGRIDLMQNGVVRQIDARSSDAVCLALGARVPIFVMVHVLAQAGMTRDQLLQQGVYIP